MAKKSNLTAEQSVEIVVATYWPTRIVKEVTIKDLTRDGFRDEITISAAAAKYLTGQLQTLFGEAGNDKKAN